MTAWKQNWHEVRDCCGAFWRNKPLARPPVPFASIGSQRNPTYHCTGYDYTK